MEWFISIQTQRDVVEVLPVSTSAIGVDVGIVHFASLSNGRRIAALNSFKKHQERLARYQRRMSRKIKFSQNWKKAKAKVQRVHIDIANARKDFDQAYQMVKNQLISLLPGEPWKVK